MINGLNHITIAVSDLERSVHFYKNILGLTAHVVWDEGAYFSAGDLWYCLSVNKLCEKTDYTHIAFNIEASDFPNLCNKLNAHGVKQWKSNSSEGDSYYFLDPDGHKLELHVGTLQSRLDSVRANPYANMRWL